MTKIEGWGRGGESAVKSIISLQPNPARDMVTINYRHNEVMQDGIIRVTDLYGRIIKEQKVLLRNGDNNFKVNMAEFASGLYTVIITMRESARNVAHKLELVK
jgi:hypothetical protein